MTHTKTGEKFDTGKERWDLLPLEALKEVVEVLTYGAAKYEPNGWKRVPDGENRYYAAQQRHSVANRLGEDFDEESNLLHLAHEACNALFRLQLKIDQLQEDL